MSATNTPTPDTPTEPSRPDDISAWDWFVLGMCFCGHQDWRPGPEGGASQMFQCGQCKREFIVHPGRRERVQR
jgi:hypothetical protein